VSADCADGCGSDLIAERNNNNKPLGLVLFVLKYILVNIRFIDQWLFLRQPTVLKAQKN